MLSFQELTSEHCNIQKSRTSWSCLCPRENKDLRFNQSICCGLVCKLLFKALSKILALLHDSFCHDFLSGTFKSDLHSRFIASSAVFMSYPKLTQTHFQMSLEWSISHYKLEKNHLNAAVGIGLFIFIGLYKGYDLLQILSLWLYWRSQWKCDHN